MSYLVSNVAFKQLIPQLLSAPLHQAEHSVLAAELSRTDSAERRQSQLHHPEQLSLLIKSLLPQLLGRTLSSQLVHIDDTAEKASLTPAVKVAHVPEPSVEQLKELASRINQGEKIAKVAEEIGTSSFNLIRQFRAVGITLNTGTKRRRQNTQIQASTKKGTQSSSMQFIESIAQIDDLSPEEQIASRRFGALIFTYATHFTKDREEARDLCSATLLKSWNAIQKRQYIPTSGVPFRAYVYMIMRNHFLSQMRRKKWTVEVEDFDLMASIMLTTQPTQERHALLLGPVLEAMRELPDAQRLALEAMAKGLSYQQAAKELGVALGTIKSRIGRGREALNILMGHEAPSI